MTNEGKYIVVGAKAWNRKVFDDVVVHYPGEWHFIGERKSLTVEAITAIDPRYIFFLHWSWKVPAEIFSNYECVCFHMTDVPYGRGGSPLQNLIVRGHRKTKLTALRMVEDFDAGPVYLKRELCLEGNAEEIYIRASYLSAKMIGYIIEEEPVPQSQEGKPTIFKRRKPHQSKIPSLSDMQDLYDFIRMLDAEGYPKAFLEHEGFCYEFSRVSFYDGRLVADVKITPLTEETR